MTLTERSKVMMGLCVVGVALGLMISLQYKNAQGNSAFSMIAQQDVSIKQLADKVKAEKDYNDATEKKLNKLTAELSDYEKKASQNAGDTKSLQDTISELSILAGTTPVEGPGVMLTINDSQQVQNGNVEDSITHDWDVRSVINELFVAGAEAVSVNDVRVVSTTGVFCIGPVLKINDQRLSPPYVIKAIGSGRDLRAAMLLPGGALDLLKASDRNLTVSDPKVMSNLVLPAFSGNIESTSSAGD